MATTPAAPDEDPPAPRWTGRASVQPPTPGAAVAPGYSRPAVGVSRRSGTVTQPSPPARSTPGGRPPLRPRWGRIALVALLAVAVVAGLGTVATLFWAHSVDNDLRRTDPFA